MFGLFKSRKKIEREQAHDLLKKAVDESVQAIKDTKADKIAIQKEELARYTDVVKKHGIDGIWFLALGGVEEKPHGHK